MQVVSSSIQMQARHEFRQQSTQRESLELRIGSDTPASTPPPGERLSLSSQAQALQSVSATDASAEVGDSELAPQDQLAIEIIRRMMKVITGRDIHITTPEELRHALQPSGRTGGDHAAARTVPAVSGAGSRAPQAGFSLSYDRTDTYFESEASSFTAQGTLQTADGKSIEFSVQLNLSRSFYQEHSESLRMGDAAKIDPLVLNFGGKAAELSDTRFEFDLDADGKSEQIAALQPDSGFLALDKNGDGMVNDGRELFGPATGNGFDELAAYDQDHSGFIDANDPIFDKLRIWQRDEGGNSRLIALGQVGIGALYVGNLATPFKMTDAANQGLAEVAATGLFFREDGSPGTIQQIDYLA